MAVDLEEVRRIMTEVVVYNRHLGVQIPELRRGFARMVLPYRPEFVGDPERMALHGGIVSTLVDNCAGAAVWSTVEPGDRIATVDLRVDYLRPAPAADLWAESTVLRSGNRVAVAEVRVYAEAAPERTIAAGKGVYNVRRGTPHP